MKDKLDNSDIPLPFILRVAAQRKKIKSLSASNDGCILFRREAKLSGLSLSREGSDIEISDLTLTDL